MTITNHHKNRAQRGFSLLEVLVALFVLAIGLLGMALLQTTGLRFNTNSHSRGQATYFAYDIIDRMRANQAGFDAGNYDIADGTAAQTAISAYGTCKAAACACESSACTAANMAKYDLGRWYENQDNLLPGAKTAATVDPANNRATIVRNGNSVDVTMHWYEQDPGQSANVLKTQVWHAEL